MQMIFSPICKLRVCFFCTKIKNSYLRIILTAFKFPSEQHAEESKGDYLPAEI